MGFGFLWSETFLLFAALSAWSLMSCIMCLLKSFLWDARLSEIMLLVGSRLVEVVVAILVGADGVLRYPSANSTPLEKNVGN